jgi:hypothetical protein
LIWYLKATKFFRQSKALAIDNGERGKSVAKIGSQGRKGMINGRGQEEI